MLPAFGPGGLPPNSSYSTEFWLLCRGLGSNCWPLDQAGPQPISLHSKAFWLLPSGPGTRAWAVLIDVDLSINTPYPSPWATGQRPERSGMRGIGWGPLGPKAGDWSPGQNQPLPCSALASPQWPGLQLPSFEDESPPNSSYSLSTWAKGRPLEPRPLRRSRNALECEELPRSQPGPKAGNRSQGKWTGAQCFRMRGMPAWA